MNVICLGGAGRICREAALDLVLHSDFDRITIADVSEEVGLEVWTNFQDETALIGDFVGLRTGLGIRHGNTCEGHPDNLLG